MEKQGISTNSLKILAVIAMVCDHAPHLLQGWHELYYAYPWFLLHAFGRIAAPIFFFLLALGYRRTRDVNRYTMRLLVFACISYLPYIWYLKDAFPNKQNFLELNVIFTMLFGLLILRAVHEIQSLAPKILCIVLCLLGGYWCDYGLYGIAMILVCDVARDSRRGTILAMGAVMLAYVYFNISRTFTSSAGPFEYIDRIGANPILPNYLVVTLCQLLPLLFIAFHTSWYKGARAEKRPAFLAKWGFYIFYPAHLTVLLLIKLFLI